MVAIATVTNEPCGDTTNIYTRVDLLPPFIRIQDMFANVVLYIPNLIEDAYRNFTAEQIGFYLKQ